MENSNQHADVNVSTLAIYLKPVLTSNEAAAYLGISMSSLYKLTMRREIPHFKPCGKIIYFNREELEAWAQRNRIATNEEIVEKANHYLTKQG